MTRDNISFLFDFNIFKKPYTYKFIIDNQEFLRDDMGHFTHTKAFRDNNNYILYVPYDKFHQDNLCFRVYLYSRQRNLAFPVIVEENTKFINFPEYGISKLFENEICCFISNNIELLKDIYSGKKDSDDVYRMDNLLFFPDIIGDDSLSESLTMKSKKYDSGCVRGIWVDENRETTHSARIKFQHNNSSNTKEWATMIIDEARDFPVEHMNNATIKSDELKLIRCFVRYNKNILLRLFNSKDNYSINDFLIEYQRVNNKGKLIVERNNLYLLDHKDVEVFEYINKDTFIIYNYNSGLSNVIIKGKLISENWFNVINFDENKKQFLCRSGKDKVIFDIKGKRIK